MAVPHPIASLVLPAELLLKDFERFELRVGIEISVQFVVEVIVDRVRD